MRCVVLHVLCYCCFPIRDRGPFVPCTLFRLPRVRFHGGHITDVLIVYRDGKPGCFAAIIHVLPGTHHVRFLVDGIMQTSPDLPTTVDFGNNLVNYIEVSPEDPNKVAKPPVAAPVAADKDKAEAPAAAATAAPQTRPSRSSSLSGKDQQPKAPPKNKPVLPADAYRGEIPQYLQDFDQAEDSPAYQNAVTAIDKLPTPPSLPGFLGKPILNAAVLMKDDNSVLNMPNHTVLNHLATSSIKNGILAVSATTRYRNKVSLSVFFLASVLTINAVCHDYYIQAHIDG